MFWKEKRVEKKLEKEIGRKERELAGSTDPLQRGSLLDELALLKEEKGDLCGAISALLDKFKEDRKVETLKKLRPILEKHSEFDLRKLEERLFESSENLDRTTENDLLKEIYSIDGKLALQLSLRFFEISREYACGLSAIDIMERILSENGREHDVSIVETVEEYHRLVNELVEISPDRGEQILARAAGFSKEKLGNLEPFLDFSLRRLGDESSLEVRSGIVDSVIEKFDNLATVFEKREGELLNRLEVLLSPEMECKSVDLLLEHMIETARSINDSREELYLDRKLKRADSQSLKSEAMAIERALKKGVPDISQWKRLAKLYRYVIDLSQDLEEKILYIRKLGVLLRDKLEDYEGSLRVFEEGMKLKESDITLWLVKGMTLEKMAQNHPGSEATCDIWKAAYDHYLKIAEKFDEQEIKLSAIEKCAIIQSEKLSV